MTAAKFTTPTKMPGGIARLIQVCEDLRTRNTDGYISGQGTLLASIKGGGHVGKATTCSPFTGTAIGLAFDPKYPRDDLNGDPYVPMYNGGADPLPFADFYAQHNNKNDPVGSLVSYGLGTKIDPKKMRRGDQLAIDWWHGSGHSVFVWDVHLDKNGNVDCFQIIGSHGPSPGYGLHVYWAFGKHWLTGKISNGKPGTGTLGKANGSIFVDDEDMVREAVWFGIKGVKPGSIDTSTFRVKPKYIVYAETKSVFGISIGELSVGRFNYDGDPPAPYCMPDGVASALPTGGPPGHVDVQSTVVKSGMTQATADGASPAASAPAASSAPASGGGAAPSGPATPPPPKPNVDPTPAAQNPGKPLNWQKDVEAALGEFHKFGWIAADPGDSTDLNDAKSQKAIKELQGALKLQVDGIVGPKTRAAIAKELPAAIQTSFAQLFLVTLHNAGKLKCDPGTPDGVLTDASRDAIKEFQKANGLDPSGLPQADTLARLGAAATAHEEAPAQGKNPMITGVYFVGNSAAPGANVKLRVLTSDVKAGQTLQIFLKDNRGQAAEVAAGVVQIGNVAQSEAAVPLPASFTEGAVVSARVEGTADGGQKLAFQTVAPLYVRTSLAAPASGDLETFFKFQGTIGESNAAKDHTYIAYRVPGKPQAWFMMGRLMIDVDGAPNCYDPKDANVNTNYLKVDLANWKGSLDWTKNGGHPGNWFGVVTDNQQNTGTPIIQGPNDPFPGFYVASTSLVDKTKKASDPKRYVDARFIPYLAFPGQVWRQSGPRYTAVTPGHSGNLGDFLTVINPKADDAHRYAHAVFADMGGGDDPHFGEGSPALGQKINASGVVNADLLYILYPGSGAGQGVIPTADQVHDKGEALFQAWGGLDEAMRVMKLMK